MNTIARLTWVSLIWAGLTAVAAAAGKVEAGPKGGRILETTVPKAEFFVEKDRAVTIAFYDAALKPVAATTQSVVVVAETTAGRVRLEFAKEGDVLKSKGKLPEGEGHNLVVQFRQTAEARQANFRFKLETHICDGCKRAEYACTCDE